MELRVAESTAFEAGVRRYYGLELDSALPNDQRAIWYQYAMDTNRRGDEVARHLSRILRQRWDGTRVLDVGCGYGGLTRAFARRGAYVIGVERSEALCDLARMNLRGEDRERWRLEHTSLEEMNVERAGTFDLIVCDNVLEHVQDPRSAIVSLARLLNDQGYLYIAVPSCAAPAQIRSDPHFGLPGIVLLHPTQAARCWAEMGCDGEYDVGFFSTPEEYFTWMNSVGLDCDYAVRTTYLGECFEPTLSRVEAIAAEVDALAEQVEGNRLFASLSAAMGDAMRSALQRYRQRFQSDLMFCRMNPHDQEVSLFLEWYGPLVWHFLAKPSADASGPSRPGTLLRRNAAGPARSLPVGLRSRLRRWTRMLCRRLAARIRRK
jgi:2-polyprenyl-3-methyl-5-hydroxy-6-metoxy-1,4-benzoquinol methylase